jgi:hypothetical protein
MALKFIKTPANLFAILFALEKAMFCWTKNFGLKALIVFPLFCFFHNQIIEQATQISKN